MAEEPQPADAAPSAPPSGQKAAESAALSNLSDAAPDTASSTPASTAALGAALSNLSVGDSKNPAATATKPKAADAPAKKIKIDQADVSFLVDSLEKALEDFILPKTVKSSA